MQSQISIVQGGLYNTLNNGACTIIPYSTVELKHIWQVYVTSEQKWSWLVSLLYVPGYELS